ncbi:acyltransferase-domain-containing protein [Pisolithus orientalis]|uniref:acyltransferase-domain-containing protein n=1 Tax=Pisolithus orientalis TaxID=936130 RepID=UPI002224BE3E|nr:acyltransferase-domain-containing protein [Pisolithus orientalis]KAI6035522.1 acyltransferase-domain-containing protein [Pisolithus orientalis]
MSQLLSTAVITATGLTCKAFLNSGLCSITISNLPVLLDALQDQSRRKGQGLITVSNHLSTLDDPVTWGVLPSRCYMNPRTIRWALGASDIMFTNPVFSAFFRNGQVIETFRGEGIFQPALDAAIDKLNQGHWVHLFGEGKVCQPPRYPQVNGVAHLQRFKWGVARIIIEANILPIIIPMWLTGFDKLMPEGRRFPFKFFPKLGVKLGVAFGDPIPPARILTLLDTLPNDEGRLARSSFSSSQGNEALHTHSITENPRGRHGATGEKFLVGRKAITQEMEIDYTRSEVTAIIQRAVENLGRKVSGNQLDRPLV